jgi:hypothetical protein
VRAQRALSIEEKGEILCSCVIISHCLAFCLLVSDAFLSYGGRSYGSNRSCRKQNQTPARPPPTSEAKKKELKITQLN